MAYLAERLVDEAARVTGIDRIELRATQSPRPRTHSRTRPRPARPMTAAIRKACSRRPWRKPTGTISSVGALRRRRAGDCAASAAPTFIEPSGGVGQEEIAIRFDAAGGMQLYTIVGPSGQGHETVFPDLVAEILGLAAENDHAALQRPRRARRWLGTGSFGSRSLISHGGALSVGAREVIRNGTGIGGEGARGRRRRSRVRARPLPRAGHRPLRSASTSWRASMPATGAHPLDAVAKINTSAAFPSGAHVAEVEIDPDTGALELVRYVAVDDCGQVYNHVLVEAQLHGGLVQGIGQILGEQCVYDRDTGQLLTGTFMDYYMPRADCAAGALAARPLRFPRRAIRLAPREPAKPARPGPFRPSPMRSWTRSRRSGFISWTCPTRRTGFGRRSNGPDNRSRTQTVRKAAAGARRTIGERQGWSTIRTFLAESLAVAGDPSIPWDPSQAR